MNAIELPFLFQTRTILRCSSPAARLRSAGRRPKLRRCLSAAPSVSPEEPSESFLLQKAREASELTRRKSKPSITRKEQQVFEGIFHDIKTSPGRPANAVQDANETDPDVILRLFVQEPGDRRLSSTETGSAYTAQENIYKPSAALEDHIRRYPSSLRYAARQVAILPDRPNQLPYRSFQPSEPDTHSNSASRGISKDHRHGVYRPLDAALETEEEGNAHLEEGLQLRNFDAVKEDEIARGTFRGKTADYVGEELKRISADLQSCISTKSPSGAFKIWDICQNEILPIVLALDKQPEPLAHKRPTEEGISAVLERADSETAKSPKKTSKKRSTKQQLSQNEPLPITPNTKLIPPGVSPLSVVTTIYPTLTLLTLRLFTTHFPTSPFALTLYTTLKSTSPHSRILALNTHFYNTLLAHLWAIYSDMQSLTSLLAEMQASSLDFDGNTYTLLRAIEDERWTQVQRGEGTRGADWWARPEQVRRFAELLEWKRVVTDKLQEQGLGHLLAEREYSSDLLRIGRSEREERPMVFL